MTHEAARTVDARGRHCPVPVIELARRIGDVAVGEVVVLLADDEAARVDVPAWCELRGHQLIADDRADTYLVRRLH